jgi:hypothetical protein
MKPEWLKGQLIQMYEAALYFVFYKFCFQSLQPTFWNKPKTFTLQNIERIPDNPNKHSEQ